MIDYQRLIEFCLENSITVEEFFFLQTLKMRNETHDEDLMKKMNQYYNQPKIINYGEIAKNLEKRGLIRVSYKITDEDKKIHLNHVTIRDSYEKLLYVSPNESWEKFLNLYPRLGLSPNGTEFFANIPQEGDKEFFISNVIKNGDRHETARLFHIVEDLFSDGTKATYGISRFIKNWKTISKNWEEGIRSKGLYMGARTL